MLRRIALVIAVSALLVGATGCRRTQDNTVPEVEAQDRVIAAVARTDDPAKLKVEWFPAPCETFDQVMVELDEEYANLTVRVSVDVTTCPDGAISETVVDLGEPLGERRVWDRAFGDTVKVDG